MDAVRSVTSKFKTLFSSLKRVANFLLFICLFSLAVPAQAVVRPGGPSADELTFPRPDVVRQQVRFWQRIFYSYPSTTVVVHEANDPDTIIDVIDYKAFAARDKKTGIVPRKEREEVTQKYVQRYTKAIERFVRFGKDALQFGAIEKRVFLVFKRNPESLARLYAGKIKIRAQTGLADDFLSAAKIARAYLPQMEQVFKSYGLPKGLTRLPFVESMFNVKAMSKVGASGIWQFMPGTARHFLYVNKLVDERNAPHKATRAAAQLFTINYRDLRSWPLAITAYNHGKLGMERAVKKIGSRDLGQIIKSYDAPSFGFASRNFYAEFLAAMDTFDKISREGLVATPDPIPATEAIVLKQAISIAKLIKYTPLTREILESHNLCLLETTFTKNAQKPLPAFYEIRVPRHLATAIKTSLQATKNKRYATR
jgi:membrane-bound lytic murein transglycosylase D